MADREPVAEILRPIELAGSLIFDEQGRILLIHRTHRKTEDGKGQLETVGGGLEPGESAQEAAAREASEEAGVEIEIESQLGVLNFTEENRDFRYTLFVSRIISGIPRPTEPEKHDAVRFWSLDELQSTDQLLSANVQAMLKAVSLGEITLPQKTS